MKYLAPRNIGAIYVLIALVIVFSILSPVDFADIGTAKIVLNQYAVTGLIALALLLPLASGLYDLSVGSTAGLAGIATAWMLANVSTNVWLAIAVGVGAALLAGVFNCLVVLVFGIDSFIGTLASGSIFLAVTTAISGDNTIATNVNGAFQENVALTNLAGITLPVFIALVAVVGLYIALEKMTFGRELYAIGFDVEVARLGGVRVFAVRAVALLVSALLAGLGGILATAKIGAGTPATGPGFLLPAFAAAFLGATQIRQGRFNAGGTVIAILLLGTGDVGLVIVGAPQWAPAIFEGVVLIAAVALTSVRLADLPAFMRRRVVQADSVEGDESDDLGSAPSPAPIVASGSRSSA